MKQKTTELHNMYYSPLYKIKIKLIQSEMIDDAHSVQLLVFLQ